MDKQMATDVNVKKEGDKESAKQGAHAAPDAAAPKMAGAMQMAAGSAMDN